MATETMTRSPAEARLLSFLVKRGTLDREKARAVEQWAAAEDVSVIEILHRKGVLRDEALASTLAEGLHLPLLHLPTAPFDTAATRLLDEATVTRFTLVPVRTEKGSLVVGMANPFDHEAIKDIEFATSLRVRPAVAPRSHVLDAIQKNYKFDNSLRTILSNIPDTTMDVVTEKITDADMDVRALQRETEQAPVVKMVNLILVEAVKNKASDIHIEPGPNLVTVRYRVNGVLEDALTIPHWVQNPVIARIKVMASLDITERRVPQDGRVRVRFQDSLVDLRVSSLPTSYGEKIVMRVLDPATALRRLDRIGLSDRDLGVLRAAIRKPEGMLLVTGPTGSGKTTTLYAVIQEIFTPELNIVTIEDPIEYEIKGVSQVAVNERQGLTFAGALRSILRQDPDVVLVGEIRDQETAAVAFQAAQTGHLVLSTLHTNDTAATITRLLDLGLEPYLVASSLVTVIAQRLVRTVCQHCAEPLVVNEETTRKLGVRQVPTLRHGRGCSSCHNTGYETRTAVYEVLEVSKGIQKLIESRAPESALRALARREGMTTLTEDAVAKIESGQTTPEEVLRAVQVEARGLVCPSCSSPIEESFTVCPYCQAQLRLTCSSCGNVLRKEWSGCPVCGTLQGTAAASATVATTPPVEARAPAPPAPSPPAAHEPLPERDPAPGGTIDVPQLLIVDDNEDLRRLVKLTLERSSPAMKVDGAANGYEALGKIEATNVHLVILDLMMPEMDGFEVCRRLRSNLKTALIPILMLTAREDTESRIQGFLAGTDDYIVKPFNREELSVRVQRLLERTYGWKPKHAGNGPEHAAAQAQCARVLPRP